MLWRCEPPAGPEDLAPLATKIRALLARHHRTPLEETLKETMDRNVDAPLTPEEQEADRRQEELIRWQQEQGVEPPELRRNSTYDLHR